MDADADADADAGGDAQIEVPARSRFMVFEREADRAAYDAWLRPPAQCHATRKATLQLACAIEVLLIMCNFTSIADTRRIWQYVLGIHSLLMLVLLGPELALVLQRRKHVQSTKPATGDDEAPSPQASRSTLAAMSPSSPQFGADEESPAEPVRVIAAGGTTLPARTTHRNPMWRMELYFVAGILMACAQEAASSLILCHGDTLDTIGFNSDPMSKAACEAHYLTSQARRSVAFPMLIFFTWPKVMDVGSKLFMVGSILVLYLVAAATSSALPPEILASYACEMLLFMGCMTVGVFRKERQSQALFVSNRSLKRQKRNLERRVRVLRKQSGLVPSSALDTLHQFGRDVAFESANHKTCRLLSDLITRFVESPEAYSSGDALQAELVDILDVANKLDGATVVDDAYASALRGADHQTREWARTMLGADLAGGDDAARMLGWTSPNEERFDSQRQSYENRDDLDFQQDWFQLDELAPEKSDIFKLQHSTGNKPITFLLRKMLFAEDAGRLGGAARDLGLQARGLLAFAARLDGEYAKGTSNSYHDNVHGADVLHAVYFLLSPATHAVGAQIKPKARLIACLAAACHDFHHLGRTNMHIINVMHSVSLQYTDVSVQERMHVSEALKLMKETAGAWPSEREHALLLRAEMTALILATDLACSSQYISEFRSHADSVGAPAAASPRTDGHVHHAAYPFDDEKARRSFLCMVMKVSDISHPLRAQSLHLRWTQMMLDEFFAQGDTEKQQGLPISPLCDRNTVSVANAQLGFIDFVVKPTMEPLFRMMQSAVGLHGDSPKTDALVTNLHDNYDYWARLGEANLDVDAALARIEEAAHPIKPIKANRASRSSRDLSRGSPMSSTRGSPISRSPLPESRTLAPPPELGRATL